MNGPNRFLALLFGGLLMLAVILVTVNEARADCPGGVCNLPPLPKVVKGEVSVVASRTIQAARCPRELTCKPKCHKRFRGVVRRVIRRFGR